VVSEPPVRIEVTGVGDWAGAGTASAAARTAAKSAMLRSRREPVMAGGGIAREMAPMWVRGRAPRREGETRFPPAPETREPFGDYTNITTSPKEPQAVRDHQAYVHLTDP
jgi:hypothetical protein